MTVHCLATKLAIDMYNTASAIESRETRIRPDKYINISVNSSTTGNIQTCKTTCNEGNVWYIKNFRGSRKISSFAHINAGNSCKSFSKNQLRVGECKSARSQCRIHNRVWKEPDTELHTTQRRQKACPRTNPPTEVNRIVDGDLLSNTVSRISWNIRRVKVSSSTFANMIDTSSFYGE
jgi:hypothetical protein